MIITSTLMAAALAGTPVPDARGTAAPAATPQPTATTKAGKPVLYCIREALTGSRVERKICKTRAEWADAGMPIDRP